MNINQIDIFATRETLQNHVKNEANVTFKDVPIFKMNFKELFTIVENSDGKRVYIPKDQNEFKTFVDQIMVDGQPLEITYVENPPRPNYGTCPLCNGNGIYNGDTCNNCGGQYDEATAKGIVLLATNGNPCTHNYQTETIKNTYTQFLCHQCGDVYFKNL
jgi:hypothetical protein